MKLYGENEMTIPEKPKLKVGDIVRVEKYDLGTRHTKGYFANFTDEEFKIIGVYRGIPTMHKIQDLGTGDKINGRFYKRELSLVKKQGVEKGPRPADTVNKVEDEHTIRH